VRRLAMDEKGFREWVEDQPWAKGTKENALYWARRVENALGIDLDEVQTETDIEQARHRLWDHISNARVMANLCWSMRKYVHFRTDTASRHQSAKAGR